MATVAVLMPVYNAAAYLNEAIDSILNQTYTDFDFFIINDGSKDESEKIILSYTDKRIKYVLNEKNLGLVDTLNKGLSMIDSKYIVRMDADDISFPNRLSRLVEEMEKSPETGVASSGLVLFGAREEEWIIREKDEDLKAGLLFTSTIPHAPCIIRTEVLKKHKLQYRFDYPHMEDYDLWFRLMPHTRFKGLPDILYKYRIEQNNVTILNAASYETRMKNFYRDHFKEIGLNYTERDLDMHFGLARDEKWPPSRRDLIDFKAWYQKILRFNKKSNVFAQAALKKLLKQKERSLFFRMPAYGLKYVFNYWMVYKSIRLTHFRFLMGRMLKRG